MITIRSLTEDDLDAARTLSTQAGWNQIGPDWKRLLTLYPDGCFAGSVDGALVATTTVVTYDDVSWIGMVLVDKDHRNEGYGSQLFERGLEFAHAHGGDVVGLDATPMGEPIYRKYGFERVVPVFRWQGRIQEPSGFEPSDEITRTEQPDAKAIERLCAFDRHQVAVDREPLLRALVSEPDVHVVYSRGSTGIDGYAIVRPGRTHWQIGPIVTADATVVETLLGAVAHAFDGADVIVDTPDRGGIATLASVGLSRERELVRMTVPDAEPALLTDSVWAFLDFAFG